MMDDMKKQAKLDVLKEIRKIASQAMQDDIKANGLKKVSVASDSAEGLEAGLEKAKEMLEAAPEMEEKEDEMDGMEDMEEEMSPDDIEAKIKALQEKKSKLMQK